MPPVGPYVSALSVSSDRRTGSRNSPSYRHFDDQSRQYSSVSRSAASASTSSGGGLCDGRQLSVKDLDSPSRMVNSPTLVRFSPRRGTSPWSTTMSGPATARSPLAPCLVTHGTSAP